MKKAREQAIHKKRNQKAERKRIKANRANRELPLTESMNRGYAKIMGLHTQLTRELLI